ncbi:MAG TPA: STAS domain-containing protein [Planctomycetota bacterium]|nr:STAS domain-containing protein [Planctomycetota bacterium]
MSFPIGEPAGPKGFRYLTIAGGRLTALRELPFHARELELGCRQLLGSDEAELTIDLSRLEYVASPQIGTLVAASARAAEIGRVLRILVNPRLERFLERLRLDGLLAYEVIQPPREPQS